MVCTAYTAGTSDVVVTAPVINLTVVKTGEMTVGGVLYETLEVRATTGQDQALSQ